MPFLNFKKEFANKILIGEKKQTIRGQRKRVLKVGDKLFLYTGLMHKNPEKLLETTIKQIKKIEISETSLKIDGVFCERLNEFAILDGFKNFDEMKNFFLNQYSLPFSGILIEW